MARSSMRSPLPSNRAWWENPPIVEEHAGFLVVREDKQPGGSKCRFLPLIPGVRQARELVFGGPFCGGAPYALATFGKREGIAVTLFYAKRRELHWRQRAAFELGAQIYQVPAGRMAVVQHRARTYAADKGAMFLPLGFDVGATEGYEAWMRDELEPLVRGVQEVWCAVGSGMLARCLAKAFPYAQVCGVTVGLASRHKAQDFPPNVQLFGQPLLFEERHAVPAPFSSCANYDRKAWHVMRRSSRAAKGRALFFNVLGDEAYVG